MESNAQPGLTLFEQIPIAFVGLFGGPEAGILPHGPITASVHSRLHPTCIRILSRIAQVPVIIQPGNIQRGVEPLYGSPRNGGEHWFLLRVFAECFLNRSLIPLFFPSFDLL
jgi:hypothetical protein